MIVATFNERLSKSKLRDANRTEKCRTAIQHETSLYLDGFIVQQGNWRQERSLWL